MPIPEIPDFEEILSRIQLAPAKPTDASCYIPLPLVPASDGAGNASQDALWLHYPSETKISFERLTERIAKELSSERHANHDVFGLFYLAFACMIPAHQGKYVARLNNVLGYVCGADVNLYYILEAKFPNNFQYEIPPFRLGRLRTDKLRYNCQKASSDFYDRYHQSLRDSFVVEREPKSVRVLEISRLRKQVFGGSNFEQVHPHWHYKAWDSLVNDYFVQQNRVLFDEFWLEFETAQDTLICLGAPYSDPRIIRAVFRDRHVAIFLNIGESSEGFVAPAGMLPLSTDLANAHERVPRVLRELNEQYSFKQFDNSALHSSIKLFASFVARARRHQLNGRLNEALLHFVIALEIIFGEREAIQKSVAERVALIAFRWAGRSFEQQRKLIDRIYEYRSRYVHAGNQGLYNRRYSQNPCCRHRDDWCGKWLEKGRGPSSICQYKDRCRTAHRSR
jgi:hypothetical protein